MNPFMSGMRFRAEFRRAAGLPAGFEVPREAVTQLGGGHPRVVATVNGYRFRSVIERTPHGYWLGLTAWRRTAAGISPAHAYDIDVELDLPRRYDDRARAPATGRR